MRFEAQIWQSESVGSWSFLTVPAEVSGEIRELVLSPVAFGSVRVEATIGGTTWRTSVFPDKGSECYVLPVKRAVRRAEDLEPGDSCRVALTLPDAGDDQTGTDR